MTNIHQAIDQEQFRLRRKLKVTGLGESQWNAVIQELTHNPCIDFAERKSEDRLVVDFDGTHYSTDELVDFIEAHGGHLSNGWWERQKIGWYRATDSNVRDNAEHEPFCCSKIPPMKNIPSAKK